MSEMTNESMPCDANREKLSALLDAELSPQETRILERHLQGCTKCRSVKEWFQCVKSAIVKSSDQLNISEDARNKILRLISQLPAETPARPWWRRLFK